MLTMKPLMVLQKTFTRPPKDQQTTKFLRQYRLLIM